MSELVTHLRTTLKIAPHHRGIEIDIDYAKSTLTIDGKSFAFPRFSPQPGIDRRGGAESLVAARLRQSRIVHNETTRNTSAATAGEGTHREAE